MIGEARRARPREGADGGQGPPTMTILGCQSDTRWRRWSPRSVSRLADGGGDLHVPPRAASQERVVLADEAGAARSARPSLG